MLNDIPLPGKVLISLGSLLVSVRSRVNDFREVCAQQRDMTLPIWNEGMFSMLDFVRQCAIGAFNFDAYPIAATDLLVEAGMDADHARELTFLVTDGITSAIIDHFPEVPVKRLNMFAHIVMEDGMLIVFTRGVPSRYNIYQ